MQLKLKNNKLPNFHYLPELANSIENAIAIAFLSTIAIAIAIDKAIFQLLLLLLLLISASSNY